MGPEHFAAVVLWAIVGIFAIIILSGTFFTVEQQSRAIIVTSNNDDRTMPSGGDWVGDGYLGRQVVAAVRNVGRSPDAAASLAWHCRHTSVDRS